jgi:hypothetical protein
MYSPTFITGNKLSSLDSILLKSVNIKIINYFRDTHEIFRLEALAFLRSDTAWPRGARRIETESGVLKGDSHLFGHPLRALGPLFSLPTFASSFSTIGYLFYHEVGGSTFIRNV